MSSSHEEALATSIRDHITPEEALTLIDALTFNGYVSNDGGDSRRLYLTLPYTDWLPTNLAQKFTRISEQRKADKRLAANRAELRDIRIAAKQRQSEGIHEALHKAHEQHGDDYTDCPICLPEKQS